MSSSPFVSSMMAVPMEPKASACPRHPVESSGLVKTWLKASTATMVRSRSPKELPSCFSAKRPTKNSNRSTVPYRSWSDFDNSGSPVSASQSR